nr:hypothetical protein Iba_chr02eCG7900 [Ipomoea batatas]
MPLSWSCYCVEEATLESPHRRTRGRESERGSRWSLPPLIAHTSRHHHRSSASNDANARETPPGFAAARGFAAEVRRPSPSEEGEDAGSESCSLHCRAPLSSSHNAAEEGEEFTCHRGSPSFVVVSRERERRSIAATPLLHFTKVAADFRC